MLPSNFDFDAFMRNMNDKLDELERQKQEYEQAELNRKGRKKQAEANLLNENAAGLRDKRFWDNLQHENAFWKNYDEPHDAEMVAQGRMDPQLYAMKYGGANPETIAPTRGTSSRSQGSGTAGLSDHDIIGINKEISKNYNNLKLSMNVPKWEDGKPMTEQQYHDHVFPSYVAGIQSSNPGDLRDINYFKDRAAALQNDQNIRSDEFNKNTFVGFKDANGNTLDANGAQIARNKRGELYGIMPDGSHAALYFSDNNPYSNGGIRGNQKWGTFGDLQQYNNSGLMPDSTTVQSMRTPVPDIGTPATNIQPTRTPAPLTETPVINLRQRMVPQAPVNIRKKKVQPWQPSSPSYPEMARSLYNWGSRAIPQAANDVFQTGIKPMYQAARYNLTGYIGPTAPSLNDNSGQRYHDIMKMRRTLGPTATQKIVNTPPYRNIRNAMKW